MIESSNALLLNSVVENADISATANTEAKIKALIWAERIDTEDIVVLEEITVNYES